MKEHMQMKNHCAQEYFVREEEEEETRSYVSKISRLDYRIQINNS